MSPKRATYIRHDQFTSAPRRRVQMTLWRCRINRLFPNLFADAPYEPGSPALGSREHFFHFLIGYLLPLVKAQDVHKSDHFLALDCGPLMTPILRETLERLSYSFEIVAPGEIEKPIYVQPWDFRWPSTEEARGVASRIADAWSEYSCEGEGCDTTENLLTARSVPHEFYSTDAAEHQGYGTGRRAITNWPEVSGVLTRCGVEHSIYEPGRHSLGCQIAAFRRARRVVGMRGAEWANAIWSTPGLRVHIYDPMPNPPKILTGLLNRLGVHHQIIPVTETHFAANPEDVLRFFTERQVD